jgi:hypothetical protein
MEPRIVLLAIGLERLDGQVQALDGLDEARAVGVGLDAAAVLVLELERLGYRFQRSAVIKVDIDPDQSSVGDRRQVLLADLQGPVMPVGIEQAGADAAVDRGGGAQRTPASSRAARRAAPAIRYCMTSMERSWATGSSSLSTSLDGRSASIDGVPPGA